MPDACIGFIDVGFLRAEGAKVLGLRRDEVQMDALSVVGWLRSLTVSRRESFLRAYWYDGAFDPSHERYLGQRRVFDGIARTPGIQLRLGHITEYPSRIRNPILRAIRNTLSTFDLDPDEFLTEFNKNWTFHPDRHQKGVDTLIALDMVRLAGRSVCSTAVLIAGDRDLAEVVRTVQDFGVRVLVAHPKGTRIARELAQLADGIEEIDHKSLAEMLSIYT